MELLESQIQTFLSTGFGYGNGYGNGYGYDSGYGSGYDYGYDSGYDNGYGYGNGSGYGDGYGYGSGYGYGYDYGYGNGYGYGKGNGNGAGSGYGNGHGYGSGSGDGNGSGDGAGYGKGIAEIEGYKVYKVDDMSTVITAVRGNVAQGYILEHNTNLAPCFIVKEANNFAHGKTLHEAYTALQEKLYDDSTEEERIAAFIEKFPEYDTPYSNEDLYHYHHVLTGSCEMGRQSFKDSHGLTLEGVMTVRQFVELTKDAYNGYIIKQLPKEYGQPTFNDEYYTQVDSL